MIPNIKKYWSGDLRCSSCDTWTEEGHAVPDYDQVLCPDCLPSFKAQNYRDAACNHCGKTYDRAIIDSTSQYCDDCKSKMRKCTDCGTEWYSDYHEVLCRPCLSKAKGAAFWNTVPPLYRATQLDKLPCRGLSEAVLAWNQKESGKCGLFLHGDSGGGKTRTAYLRLREDVQKFRTVKVIRGQQLAKDIVQQTMSDGGAIDSYLETLKGHQLSPALLPIANCLTPEGHLGSNYFISSDGS